MHREATSGLPVAAQADLKRARRVGVIFSSPWTLVVGSHWLSVRNCATTLGLSQSIWPSAMRRGCRSGPSTMVVGSVATAHAFVTARSVSRTTRKLTGLPLRNLATRDGRLATSTAEATPPSGSWRRATSSVTRVHPCTARTTSRKNGRPRRGQQSRRVNAAASEISKGKERRGLISCLGQTRGRSLGQAQLAAAVANAISPANGGADLGGAGQSAGEGLEMPRNSGAQKIFTAQIVLNRTDANVKHVQRSIKYWRFDCSFSRNSICVFRIAARNRRRVIGKSAFQRTDCVRPGVGMPA